MDPNLIPGPKDITDDIGLFRLVIKEELSGQYPYHKKTTHDPSVLKYECPIFGCKACVKYQVLDTDVHFILLICTHHQFYMNISEDTFPMAALSTKDYSMHSTNLGFLI
ncbi:hypothetical protein TVAG_326580 [Trichomonas vaginalis G3]|uniref:Uncharacterized protein n=2 Tax=Trichomonas vaginalis (strain ATCC PRA-98 / G3) TaxID=412133 RepID=A2GC46_TRIV3|nr:hypothetical protein TVAG_326580 [Trichomonas vaginalis G3]|eukprot:XP_001298201.1 hypothetical protein [Trichomonas vaginalis G3]